jgi:putative ABC transport system ATP-binding protein
MIHQGVEPVLKLVDVSKSYRTDNIETRALDDISFEVGEGEFVAIMGPSGCGKSTLLNILGLIDSPTSGQLMLNGREVSGLGEDALTDVRRDNIGFVFQSFNLIDDLSVAANVEVAMTYRGVPSGERRQRVAEALDRVGLSHRASHLPRQLSGGQQQRVAVARALVARPRLVLADEPTGNLDTQNGEAVMGLLIDAARAGTSIVMVTHSPAHAALADRAINLLDGRVVAV